MLSKHEKLTGASASAIEDQFERTILAAVLGS
jgi:hypothetical protein